jgi:hypothetical protein
LGDLVLSSSESLSPLRKAYDKTKGPIGYIAALVTLAVSLKIILLDWLGISPPELEWARNSVAEIGCFILTVSLYVVGWYAVRLKRAYARTKASLDARIRRNQEIAEVIRIRNKTAHTHTPSPSEIWHQIRASREKPGPHQAQTKTTSGRDTVAKTTVLIDRQFRVSSDEIWEYNLKVRKGGTLRLSYESTQPIEIFILDKWHYSRDDFENPVEVENDTVKGEFRIVCEKDLYYVVIWASGTRKADIKIRGWID